MKSVFLIAFLLLSGLDFAQAQTPAPGNLERFSLNLDREYQESLPYIYFDSTEYKYYLLFNKKQDKLLGKNHSESLKLIVTDNSFNVLWQKDLKLENPEFDYYYPVSIFNGKDNLRFLYTNKENQISRLVIDKINKNLSSNRVFLNLAAKEDFISFLNDGDSHYAVGYEKNNSQLNIYAISDNGDLGEKKVFKLPNPEKNDYKVWLRGIVSVNNSQPIPLILSGIEKKSFLWKDLITFTWVHPDVKTRINYVYVLKLDIKTMQINIEKWGLPDVFGLAINHVYKDKFFLFKSSDAGMSLLISNLDKPKEILKSYLAQTDPVTFRNSELVREAGETTLYYGLSDGSKEDGKASQKFMDKLNKMSLALTISENGDDYEITMSGTFDLQFYAMNTPNNTMNSKPKKLAQIQTANLMQQQMLGFPRGPNNETDFNSENESPLFDVYQIYFKSLINKNTLEQHKGTSIHLYREIEKEFTTKIEPNSFQFNSVGYYTINGKDYYSFYPINQKQFKIVREH